MDNRRRMLLSGGLSADPVLENNDWETISEISRAGKAAEFWNIGDKKNITVNGKTYAMRIIGFDHDDVTDPAAYGRAKAGITFESVIIPALGQLDSSGSFTDGWGSCEMRNTKLASLYNSMSSDLKNAIVPVNKSYALSTYASSMRTVSDKLFLLSEWEYIGKKDSANRQEGNQYAFYAAGNSPSKTYNGSQKHYWTRSKYSDYRGLTIYSKTSIGREYADSSYGQITAFCV